MAIERLLPGEIVIAVRQYCVGTTVILSLEESDDLDSSAVEALIEFHKTLSANGMALHLTRVHDRVRDLLAASGLTELAAQATYSVADAVDFIHHREKTNAA